MHNRQIKVTADFAGEFKMRCLRGAHVRNQVGKADAGGAMAAVDIEKINHAAAGQCLANLHSFIKLKAAIERFIKHHPNAYNVVVSNLSANLF